MSILEKADKVVDFIKDNLQHVAEENNKIYFQGCIDSYANARELADNEEKQTYLYDAAVKWMNQMTFLLYRHEALTDDAAKAFRKFDTPEETTKAVGEYKDARQDRINEIRAEQEAVMAEEKELDILKGVIAGMGVEEAKQKLAEYEEQT
ncbi:MAG: hypothetical protein K6D98_04110, partial [Clostridiales bacterium]|nr:hypothetical protein [Clostridiales bacterium]